jgi:hypothetical protein
MKGRKKYNQNKRIHSHIHTKGNNNEQRATPDYGGGGGGCVGMINENSLYKKYTYIYKKNRGKI